MTTPSPSGSRSLAGRFTIAVATLVAGAVVLALLLTIDRGPKGIELTADFARAAQGLREGSPVKVRGMTVGRVTAVELTEERRVRLTLRLDEGVRVPDTAAAAIEPASVFGPKFLNLQPGEHEAGGPYLADGARIARTSDSPDLTDLLGDADAAFAALDPREVATIVHTLGQGFGGQGERFRDLIDDAGTLLGVADKHTGDAQRFLADVGALTGTLTGDDLTAVIRDANALIAAVGAGPRGRLAGFADGIGDVSGRLDRVFDQHGRDLLEGFRSADHVADVLYAQIGPGVDGTLIGDGIRIGTDVLALYPHMISSPGPGQSHLLNVQTWFPSNPCEMFLGACPYPGGAQ